MQYKLLNKLLETCTVDELREAIDDLALTICKGVAEGEIGLGVGLNEVRYNGDRIVIQTNAVSLQESIEFGMCLVERLRSLDLIYNIVSIGYTGFTLEEQECMKK